MWCDHPAEQGRQAVFRFISPDSALAQQLPQPGQMGTTDLAWISRLFSVRATAFSLDFVQRQLPQETARLAGHFLSACLALGGVAERQAAAHGGMRTAPPCYAHAPGRFSRSVRPRSFECAVRWLSTPCSEQVGYRSRPAGPSTVRASRRSICPGAARCQR